jgi:hypothetical protein
VCARVFRIWLTSVLPSLLGLKSLFFSAMAGGDKSPWWWQESWDDYDWDDDKDSKWTNSQRHTETPGGSSSWRNPHGSSSGSWQSPDSWSSPPPEPVQPPILYSWQLKGPSCMHALVRCPACEEGAKKYAAEQEAKARAEAEAKQKAEAEAEDEKLFGPVGYFTPEGQYVVAMRGPTAMDVDSVADVPMPEV